MTGAAPGNLAPWVALSLIPGLGARTLDRLLETFGSFEAILAASPEALMAVPRVGPKTAAAIGAVDLAQTRADIARWQAAGIAILLHTGADYPAALKTLDDPPPVVFRRGVTRPQDARAIAVVGTRRPSPQARAFASRLAAELAIRCWTVVSGLAAGIDTAAHRGALDAGGRTLAVLGSGLGAVYPTQNARLAARIEASGALFCEIHPDAAPSSPALVARNRLISGLSHAVIVIEAGARSGSLHAARFAEQQGRIVFAVDCAAPGNRQLIAGGARPLALDMKSLNDLP
jgi:DNA processing protein